MSRVSRLPGWLMRVIVTWWDMISDLQMSDTPEVIKKSVAMAVTQPRQLNTTDKSCLWPLALVTADTRPGMTIKRAGSSRPLRRWCQSTSGQASIYNSLFSPGVREWSGSHNRLGHGVSRCHDLTSECHVPASRSVTLTSQVIWCQWPGPQQWHGQHRTTADNSGCKLISAGASYNVVSMESFKNGQD